MSGSLVEEGDFAHTLVLALGIVGGLVLVAALLLAMADAGLRSLAFGRLVREFLAWRRAGQPDRTQARMEERKRCAEIALLVAKELERMTNPRTRGDVGIDDVNIALAARGTALRIADAILAETHRAGTSERVA
mgnify:FL=1